MVHLSVARHLLNELAEQAGIRFLWLSFQVESVMRLGIAHMY